MEATPRSQPPHNIALLPPPTFLGHLIPFIELAKKLVFHHNCTITLIIPDDGSSMKPQKSLLQGLPTTINTVFLPTSSYRRSPGERKCRVAAVSPPDPLISSSSGHVDFPQGAGNFSCCSRGGSFAIDAIDIAKQFGIPEIPGPSLPGAPPGEIRTGTEAESDGGSECVKWLNDHPPKSVLFVSFGSGGTLSVEQFKELALGLEMCGHRFLWVVRTPQESAADAYLNTQSIVKDPLDFLPEGFLERTKGRGLVVVSWAPQIQVLSHGSTGGFVTHCGWNSILESASFGVPLIAWPLCFEHRMNAVFLTDGLKAAIRVKENENGVVGREQIAELVKRLMEGEEGNHIRKRMSNVKIAAGNALSQEGSSTKALAHVVQQWISWK
ncbi:UNVERIFIED_CONTAM: Hydroquinone glucosyltransferase [Sesamum latifolium]|uniref:Hydroquinone glucosyltransferase n=1 Tax=Sesamum latifolium TaxID=2727402 RepID=A0AAW2XTJ4_9LAMI